ncbi:hypothetical protein NL676_036190 [Syzygium grande]|nr:hypothetical protein NL676_036190 [Syzygium grande]
MLIRRYRCSSRGGWLLVRKARTASSSDGEQKTSSRSMSSRKGRSEQFAVVERVAVSRARVVPRKESRPEGVWRETSPLSLNCRLSLCFSILKIVPPIDRDFSVSAERGDVLLYTFVS